MDLVQLAHRAMMERGFFAEPPAAAQEEAEQKTEPVFERVAIPDLSSWLWSSIDNDDSRDLDQIEFAQRTPAGARLYVAIADVDSFVPRYSALDSAAGHNTTSVYTGVATFPMLPERLSTDLSSLNEGQKRLAMVVEMAVGKDGRTSDASIYPAIVQNKAQLTYIAVAAWLDRVEAPASAVNKTTLAKIAGSPQLQEQLRLQDEIAAALRQARHDAGALMLEVDERRQNRASHLIEDFMIASNKITARFLDQRGFPSLRRVVKSPERWDRIVALAASFGQTLPPEPDVQSLSRFLETRRRAEPAHFSDLSLAVVKLVGRGEYVAKSAAETAAAHFALAADAYAHSTAPNRRFPDLVTQRLLKAALANLGAPYGEAELSALAAHCTERENAANKVERFVRKCAEAEHLRHRIGNLFRGVVSGVTNRGTWVRISEPQIEGKLYTAGQHLDVGDRVQVRLVAADASRGFIDFELAPSGA